MRRLKQVLLSVLFMASAVFVAAAPSPAYAINVFEDCTTDVAVCNAAEDDDAIKMVKTGIDTALQILGIIGVIMIIVGGFRYTTSGGDAAKLKNARDTIIYAVVGLVVAILSYAIVNFVIDKF